MFIIAGSFDVYYTKCWQFWWNTNKKRGDSVYFETKIERTERNKQFVMTESTKVTKKRKWESTIIHGHPQKFFQGGQRRHFVHLQIADDQCPSKIILHWANICFSEHN